LPGSSGWRSGRRSEATHHIGHGSSTALAPRLGLISIVCAVLYAVPPASILAAMLAVMLATILFVGCLSAALVPHARSGGVLPAHILIGICLALLVWGGPWWHERDLRLLSAFRRWRCCIEN
jgi:hypothetical protein